MKILDISSSRSQRGQTMIAGMGLMLVSASVIFMLFNSNRAVTEKINLVNAADAVAYSGALVASRELNFMAYTNRTMIANEVAIGHMVSFQSEISLVEDVFSGGLRGLGSQGIIAIFDAILGIVGSNVASVAQAWGQGMRAVAGTYILSVDATNALYNDFQEEEYSALIGDGPNGSIVDVTMQQVAQKYVKNTDVTILVNDASSIDSLIGTGLDSDLSAKMELAKAGATKEFCYLIMFASPGDSGGGGGATDTSIDASLRGYCNDRGQPLPDGAFTKPLADSGVLMDLVQRSAETAKSADWITDRNLSYSPVFTLGNNVARSGETKLEWDSVDDQYNWVAEDKVKSTNWLKDIIAGVDAEGSGDAKSAASFINGAAPWAEDAIGTLLSTFGWCDDIDCDAVKNGEYKGIQKYATINPLISQATIRVVLTQTANCNDTIGRDDITGAKNAKWHDDQTRYDTNCGSKPLTAYSAAQVYYDVPGCDDPSCTGFDKSKIISTQANLFNPFWQARLAP